MISYNATKAMLYFTMMSLGLAGSISAVPLSAEQKLVQGQDRIDTPAIGTGLCLHNLFQSHMVLQRDKPVTIWGWADKGDTITVSFAGQVKTAKVGDDGAWQVVLDAMPACTTGRTLNVKSQISNLKCQIDDVLVGDIWLLGGQSNMEFEIAKLDEGPLEIISANFNNIRLFTVPQQNGPEIKNSFPRQHQWHSFFGQHYRQGYWDVCTPETVPEMSGIGYIFARRIHMATQIPIGLVDVSRGGTSLATWTPTDVVKKIDAPEVKSTLAEWDKKVSEFNPQKDLENRITHYNDWVARMKASGREKEIPADSKAPSDVQAGPAIDMNRPGNCYASTLSTLAGMHVKGAIWHQGYNEGCMPNGHKLYAAIFPEMIKSWRKLFNDPTMPFGIITQETDGQPQTLEEFLPKMLDEGTYVREAHYQTFLNMRKAGDKNIGYASTFDLHRAWYHPQIKIPAGERMAKWALATQYGKNIHWLPPQLKEVVPGEGKLILKMDSGVGPHNNSPVLGFAIAGKDGRFQPAKAEYFDRNAGKGQPNLDSSALVLSSPLIPKPFYFRYAWARNPLENLKSNGLPFDTQRNDTWTMADMYEMYTGKKPATPGVLHGGEMGELTKALRAEDLKRRIEEAKSLFKANNIKIDN